MRPRAGADHDIGARRRGSRRAARVEREHGRPPPGRGAGRAVRRDAGRTRRGGGLATPLRRPGRSRPLPGATPAWTTAARAADATVPQTVAGCLRPRPDGAPLRRAQGGRARRSALELRTLAGCLWHIVRRRCAIGVVMAAQAAGRLREAVAGRGRAQRTGRERRRLPVGNQRPGLGRSRHQPGAGRRRGVRRIGAGHAAGLAPAAGGRALAPAPGAGARDRAPGHAQPARRGPCRAAAQPSRGALRLHVRRRPRQVREPQRAARGRAGRRPRLAVGGR